LSVIEATFNSKAHDACSMHDPRDFPHALNSKLLTAPFWRWQEHLNPNVRTDRRTLLTSDQCAVKRNIACESAFSVVDDSIVPMKDDRQLELVSHGRPAVHVRFKDLY
jgi:hypothetical protein